MYNEPHIISNGVRGDSDLALVAVALTLASALALALMLMHVISLRNKISPSYHHLFQHIYYSAGWIGLNVAE